MIKGERIKYLREKNGLTQKDIATRLGVESVAISKYELDMREPNIEAIKNLLQYLMFQLITYLEEHQSYLLMKVIEVPYIIRNRQYI